MHIPDAFIPIGQAVIYWLIALICIGLSVRWTKLQLSEEKLPLVAVLAAGIFAIQAFNLPIGLGTSGHLVGGALAAIILGSPWAAVFILTLVLIIQGFIFGDGGITTMGANIINMGVIGGFCGYYTFTGLKRIIHNPYASAAVAGWVACFIPALACSIEMALAGTFPLIPGMVAMGLYHALIGIIEGLLTAAIIYLLVQARPDLVENITGGESNDR